MQMEVKERGREQEKRRFEEYLKKIGKKQEKGGGKK